jgi:hypothetical protein
VQAFAVAHLGKNHRRAVIAGNVREFVDAMKKSYPDAQTIPLATLDLDRADLRKP